MKLVYPLALTTILLASTVLFSSAVLLWPAVHGQSIGADFSISIFPSSLSIKQGSSGSAVVSLGSIEGYSENVDLSSSGEPPGMVVTISPSSLHVAPGAQAVVNVDVANYVPPGFYTLTITGRGGILPNLKVHSAYLSVQVISGTPSGDFSLSVTPGVLTIIQGGSGSSTANVFSINGFSNSVHLSAQNVPGGISVNISPQDVTPPQNSVASATVFVGVSSGVASGSYAITISGTGGILPHVVSHSTQLVVEVQQPSPPQDFSISVSPTVLSVDQGLATSATVTISSLAGFSSAVTLTSSGAPSGVSVNFSPNPIYPPGGGSASSLMSINVASYVAIGTYYITITGTGGILPNVMVHSTQLTFEVTQAGPNPDYTISVSPSTLTIVQGSTGSTTLTAYSQAGFSSQVSLTVSGQPGGMSINFSPNPIVPSPNGQASSAVSIVVGSSVPVGSYTVTFTGQAGILPSLIVHSVQMTVEVTSAGPNPDFSISVSPTGMNIQQGATQTATITIASIGGFSSSVHFTASGLPTGLVVNFAPNPLNSQSGGSVNAIASMSAASNTAPGIYTVTLTGRSGILPSVALHSAQVTVQISGAPAGDFSLNASPNSVSMSPGSQSGISLTIQSSGSFAAPVQLSAAVPSGFSIAFGTNPVTPSAGGSASTSATISLASQAIAAGTYTITFTGTSGSLSHSATVSVTVSARCFIATATFGSELAPEVQILRSFRDNQIMRTRAGSDFMIAFNTWYYSFSPNVANSISESSALRSALRVMLYPLVWELHAGSSVFNEVSANPEIAAILAGLTVSSLIGATYLAVPLTCVVRFSRTARRAAQRLLKPAIVLTAGAVALTLASEVLPLGTIPMIAGTTIASLGTLALAALATSRALLRMAKTSI